MALKAFFAIVIFLIAYSAGCWTIYNRSVKPSIKLEALAIGVFLGAVFFHMLPEALKQHGTLSSSHYFVGLMILMLSMLLMWLASKMTQKITQLLTLPLLSGLMMIFILALHSLAEGITLGLSRQFEIVLIIFLAIALHKAAASFALTTHLLRSQYSSIQSHSIMLGFSLLTPFGILLGGISSEMLFANASGWLPLAIFAIIAGILLYIVIFEYIVFWVKKPVRIAFQQFIFCFLGAGLMGALAVWV